MYIFEIPLENRELVKMTKRSFADYNATIVEVKGIDGNNFLQLIVPLATNNTKYNTGILSYFNNKVTIKKWHRNNSQ